MKLAIKIFAVWGLIATAILICVLCSFLDREGIVEFHREPGVDVYRPTDLQSKNLPPWNLTNTIPLSPDAAIKAAFAFATGKHPEVTNWEVDSISLEKQGGGIWTYGINLIDRQTGRYVTEYPRVLMDGSIWKPTHEE